MNFVLEKLEETLKEISTIANLENNEERQEYIRKNFPGTEVDKGCEIYFLTGVIATDADYLKNFVTTYMRLKKEESEEN